MKKVLLGCLLIAGSLYSRAQSDTGIHFFQGASWQAVLDKAKAENKYVFVDCMATWCAPCKKMDHEVYNTRAVGDFTNGHFISIKVQMDSSVADDVRTQAWYATAHDLQLENCITAFPSYLFFSSDGKLVHRDLGFKFPVPFMTVLKDAANPDRQYYTLVRRFDAANLPYAMMPDLVARARINKDKPLAERIANQYIDKYLMTLDKDKLFVVDNIALIGRYARKENAAAYRLFFEDSARIDPMMQAARYAPHYSSAIIGAIISRNDIQPLLWKTGMLDSPIISKPDWTAIHQHLEKKYGPGIIERPLLDAKILWYRNHQGWSRTIKLDLLKVKQYGIDTAGIAAKMALNEWVFSDILLHSNDRELLGRAIGWIELLVHDKTMETNPLYSPWLDTYANLLYKVGRKEEAIRYEEQACTLSPRDKELADNLVKMKKGEPTWPVKK